MTDKKKFHSDLKIIVIGPTKSGKTSFVNKWVKNIFSETYRSTIVSEFGFKIFEYEQKIFRIQLWDLAGQDKNQMITKIFAKDAHGVVIVCDATDKLSREDSLKWKKAVDECAIFLDGETMPYILVENKIDLVENEVDNGELKSFSDKNGFNGCFRTSAKTGENIGESMEFLLKNIIERIKEMNKNDINEEIKDNIKTNAFSNQENENFEIINENKENKSIEEISFIKDLYKNINYKIIMKAIDDELEIFIKNINIKPFPEYYSKFKLNELQKINYFKLFNSIGEFLYEIKNLLNKSFLKIIETNQILFTIPINMRILDKIELNIKEIEKTLEEKNSLMEKYIFYLEEKIINFQTDLVNDKLNDKENIILNLNNKIQNLENINLLLNEKLENQKKKIEELSKEKNN